MRTQLQHYVDKLAGMKQRQNTRSAWCW